MTGLAARQRLTGAALALLLQILFIAALLLALRPLATPEKLVRELTLILPRLQNIPPPPVTRVRRSSSAPTMPLPPVPSVAPPAAIMPLPFTPTPEQLQGLGQSLYGCAPESWGGLTPSQRAQCTRLGEGIAVQKAPDLMNPPPDHVKDKVYWDEKFAEEHWTPAPCPPDEPLIDCQMRQLNAEQLRERRFWRAFDQQKAAALRTPPPPLPKTIGVHPQ